MSAAEEVTWPTPSATYDTERVSDEWRSSSGNRPPFLVVIYVIPMFGETIRLRQAIEAYAAQHPFYCAIVEAPVPRLVLQVNAASEIHATFPGTVGGFLRTANPPHRVFGVTCAHVASQQSSVALQDVGGQRILNGATVDKTNFLEFIDVTSGGVCNPYLNCPSADVDLALLTINQSIQPTNFIRNLGVVTGSLSDYQLQSGRTVSHQGAITGPNDYKLGGYGYMSTVEMNTATGKRMFCFSHLFDFAQPTATRFGRFAASLPTDGDSGSWIIHDDGVSRSWFGVVIAVELSRGIGIFASSILNYARQKWGLDLNVL